MIFVDGPDVLRKRNVHAATAGAVSLREVIEWEYLRDGAADCFFHRYRDLDPAAVVPIIEYGVPFAARLAERFGAVGAGYGAALALRDKRLQRAITAAAGIPNPRSVPVTGPEQVQAALEAPQRRTHEELERDGARDRGEQEGGLGAEQEGRRRNREEHAERAEDGDDLQDDHEELRAVARELGYQRNTPILVSRHEDEAGNAIEVIDFCPYFRRQGRSYRPVAFARILRPLAGAPEGVAGDCGKRAGRRHVSSGSAGGVAGV